MYVCLCASAAPAVVFRILIFQALKWAACGKMGRKQSGQALDARLRALQIYRINSLNVQKLIACKMCTHLLWVDTCVCVSVCGERVFVQESVNSVHMCRL